MAKRDYYEILDIEKTASEDEIKSAYRKKAKKYHPDLNQGDEDSHAKFREVTEAYEVLTDPEKRSRYDRFGHSGLDDMNFDNFSMDFGDIFDIFDIFSSGSRQNMRDMRNTPQRGADISYTVNLEFEEAVFGVEKEIEYTRIVICKTCKGVGSENLDSVETCPVCNGTGQVRTIQDTLFGRMMSTSQCDNCHGTGEIINEPCENCNGAKVEREEVKLNVDIPEGVHNGARMNLRGQGNTGLNGGPNGDLIIFIKVIEDEHFQRVGDDIYTRLPVSFSTVTLGGTIKVPTLRGLKDFKIKAGTETGEVFKLEDEGVKNVHGRGIGDLYFEVIIDTPKNLTKEEKEALEKFQELTEGKCKERDKSILDKIKDVFKKN